LTATAIAEGEPGTRTSTGVAIGLAVVLAGLLAIAWTFAGMNGDLNLATSSFGPDLVIPIGMGAVGALVVSRRPSNVIGWLLLGSAVLNALRAAAAEYSMHALISPANLPAVSWAAWFANWVLALIYPTGAFLFVVLLFPDGRLMSSRWRIVAGLAIVATALSIVLSWLDPTPLVLAPGVPAIPNPTGVKGTPFTFANLWWAWPVGLLLLVIAAVGLVLRYRRAAGEERHQIKWFAFAIAASLSAVVIGIPFSVASTGQSPANNIPLVLGLGVALPIASGVAILKYRLYGIDVVIHRTLVFGTLAALITAVYVGIAVGIGTLVGSGGKPNLGLSILATAIVAVGFQPVRQRLQRIANRLVYGERATPYEVLSRFSEQVAETYSSDSVLPRMAEVLREGTGAEAAAVWLRSGQELRLAVSDPPSTNGVSSLRIPLESFANIPGAHRATPVLHQDEMLGVLTVTKRRGETLTPIEEKLLDDLARQAGLVLRNVGLTTELLQRLEDLRLSRQRLVKAQDDERRRLERNLHDGAQQNLVALKVKLGLAQMMLDKDTEKARTLIVQLKDDADEALEALRDLARGIYPPLLADKGLVTAIESQARKATLPVTVESDPIGRYPQETEAAAYFCVLECLQNVQKYAAASRAVVRLREADGELSFEVRDDGRGFDPAIVKMGSGLNNMRDRLDALGGNLEIVAVPGAGCTVRGTLKVSLPAAAV
jgi:signal transduction histidine kinase